MTNLGCIHGFSCNKLFWLSCVWVQGQIFRTMSTFAYKFASTVEGIIVLRIWYFSSRQRLHSSDRLIYVFDFWSISQFILYWMLFFFKFQMYFNSWVSFLYFSFLNDFLWLLNICLNVRPVIPMYIFVSSFVSTMVWYVTVVVSWHFPCSGQFSLLLQLHSGWALVSWLRTLLLCAVIVVSMFFMQL